MRHLLTLVSPSPTPGAGSGTGSVLPTLALVVMALLFVAGIAAYLRGRDNGDGGGGWGN